jgi:hypothetical protein
VKNVKEQEKRWWRAALLLVVLMVKGDGTKGKDFSSSSLPL